MFVDRRVVEDPSSFIADRSRVALLFRFLKVAMIPFLWSASIVATCIAAHFALCRAL